MHAKTPVTLAITAALVGFVALRLNRTFVARRRNEKATGRRRTHSPFDDPFVRILLENPRTENAKSRAENVKPRTENAKPQIENVRPGRPA